VFSWGTIYRLGVLKSIAKTMILGWENHDLGIVKFTIGDFEGKNRPRMTRMSADCSRISISVHPIHPWYSVFYFLINFSTEERGRVQKQWQL